MKTGNYVLTDDTCVTINYYDTTENRLFVLLFENVGEVKHSWLEHGTSPKHITEKIKNYKDNEKLLKHFTEFLVANKLPVPII